MEKTKKRAQDVLLTAVIAVSATIAFIGGFALSGELKERSYRAKDNDNSSENTDLSFMSAGGSLAGGYTLGFDEKLVESSDDLHDYEIYLGTYSGVGDAYVSIKYGDTKSQLVFTKYSYTSEKYDEFVINFTRNVVDTHMSTFDLDVDYNTIFILLDDGSVEYILIEDAIKNNNIKSYGRVEGLEYVAKFYEGTTCEIDSPSCIKTAFAQTMDGKIYDLYDYIR